MIYVIPSLAQVYELVESAQGTYSVMLHAWHTVVNGNTDGWCPPRCRIILGKERAKKFVANPDDGYWFEG